MFSTLRKVKERLNMDDVDIENVDIPRAPLGGFQTHHMMREIANSFDRVGFWMERMERPL
jgi:hypothetical protein